MSWVLEKKASCEPLLVTMRNIAWLFTTFHTYTTSHLNNGAFHKFYSSPNWIVKQLFYVGREVDLHIILRHILTFSWTEKERERERDLTYSCPFSHGPWQQHEALLQNLKELPSSPTQSPGRKKREWWKRNRMTTWKIFIKIIMVTKSISGSLILLNWM